MAGWLGRNGMDKRSEAIQQFVELHALEETAQQVLRSIFQQQPRALLLVWESATGIGVTSVPFSMALVQGLLMLVNETFEEDEEEEEEEE